MDYHTTPLTSDPGLPRDSTSVKIKSVSKENKPFYILLCFLIISYEDLLQEKQNLEDAFLNFRREVKNTTKGSAVKEIRVLKNVVRNLEEELVNEKRKHQRAANKRNQEYKTLLEEVSFT